PDLTMMGARLFAHIETNYSHGYYANSPNTNDNNATRPGTGPQPKGDSAFTVNGRLAIADIPAGRRGQTFTIAVWARNLLNEGHAFYRSFSPLTGGTGIFNEPRTYGLEISVKM